MKSDHEVEEIWIKGSSEEVFRGVRSGRQTVLWETWRGSGWSPRLHPDFWLSLWSLTLKSEAKLLLFKCFNCKFNCKQWPLLCFSLTERIVCIDYGRLAILSCKFGFHDPSAVTHCVVFHDPICWTKEAPEWGLGEHRSDVWLDTK